MKYNIYIYIYIMKISETNNNLKNIKLIIQVIK